MGVLLFSPSITTSRSSNVSMDWLSGQIDYVVGLGDSITFGTAASAASNRWINIVQSKINDAGNNASLVNNGVAAEYTALIARRLASTERRGVVCILAGFNDMRSGIDVSVAINNLEAMLNYYEPIASIIVVGSLPYMIDYTNPIYAPYNVGSDYASRIFSNAIKELCIKHDVLFAPVYEYMDYDNTLISPDGVHPNDKGHARIAAAFWDTMKYQPIRTPIATPILPIPDSLFGNVAITDCFGGYQAAITYDVAHIYGDQIRSIKVTIAAADGVVFTLGDIVGRRPGWNGSIQTTLKAWVKADATTPAVNAFIRTNEYDAAFNFIGGTTQQTADVAITDTQWYEITHSITTNANCRGLEFNVGAKVLNSIIYVGKIEGYASVPTPFVHP